ncbi:MAG: hypothetical protein WA970_17980, partial [Gammaproteobacteria bacterium]
MNIDPIPTASATSRSMLDSLRQIVQDVNSAPNIPAALHTAVRQTRQVLDVDVCSVYFTEPDRRRHIIVATQG